MTLARRLFRRSAWLALAAMLGLALVPTLSHALNSQRVTAQPWSELCSVNAVDDVAAALVHCPLCAPSGHLAALPGSPQAAGLPAPGRAAAPGSLSAGRSLPPPWVAPPPRAPPQRVA